MTERLPRLGGVGAHRAAAAVAPRQEVAGFLALEGLTLLLLGQLESRPRASALPTLKVRPRDGVVDGLSGGGTSICTPLLSNVCSALQAASPPLSPTKPPRFTPDDKRSGLTGCCCCCCCCWLGSCF